MFNVDSSIHAEVVSAARAAKMLGVKRETLYAYASRGLLTRVPSSSGRGSSYLRADVERLKARSAARAGHGPVAAGALRWGEPVLDSAITSIDARGPAYRGHRAVELAQSGATFEQVAELLWTGELPTQRPRWPATQSPASLRSLDPLLAIATPVGRLSLLAAALAQIDAKSPATSRDAELARARRLIAWQSDLVGVGERASIAQAAARFLGAKRQASALVDLTLVVMADHELNASSFAARVAASAGADLYACVTAALATLSGARHGGECDRVERLVREAASRGGAANVVRERAERGEVIPGFGHRLYPRGDPRTAPLLDAARELAPRATVALDALVDAAGDALGLSPTVDVALVAVSRALGMPRGSATALFAIGRTAGWIAHVLEQREAGFLLRPRARYLGPPVP